MACFIVPAVEAAVTTVVTKTVEKKEAENKVEVSTGFSRKLKWLNNMLWGGSALLMFEHVWHGEITPWFPFLTNAIDSVARSEMLHEMATSGVAMTAAVTAVWAGMVAVSTAIEKRTVEAEQEA